MGGDHGAAVVIPGAELVRKRHPDIELLLFGDQAVVQPLLAAHPELAGAARPVHTDVAVKMDAKTSHALRQGRWERAMWVAHYWGQRGEGRRGRPAGGQRGLSV